MTTIKFPAGLGIERDLRGIETAGQADGIVQMRACQIARTGFSGPKQRATPEQIAWAKQVDADRLAAQ